MTEQLIFGKHTMEDAEKMAPSPEPKNPCIRIYGEKPGHICKECKFLYARQYSQVYYKCRFRKDTKGAGTDHGVNWPACGKFELSAPVKFRRENDDRN